MAVYNFKIGKRSKEEISIIWLIRNFKQLFTHTNLLLFFWKVAPKKLWDLQGWKRIILVKHIFQKKFHAISAWV
jgi:hypothetical protein